MPSAPEVISTVLTMPSGAKAQSLKEAERHG